MSERLDLVFFVATDAGGMRNVLPIARVHAEQGGRSVVCVDQESPIPAEFDLPSEVCFLDVYDESCVEMFRKQGPGGLVVGTTGEASLERRMTRLAREQGVRSIAVLDEWYNYALRFQDSNGEWNLPDRIAAMNQAAVQAAASEGIPSAILFCSGSVWLSELYFMRLRNSIGSRDLSHDSDAGGRDPLQVTFISEDFSCEVDELLEVSYDEHVVLRDLIAVLDRMDRRVSLINKVHPSVKNADESVRGTDRVTVETRAHGSLIEVMAGSDICIGMKSMGLLEARMMGVPALSYQPGIDRERKIGTAVRMGACPLATNMTELENWLSDPNRNMDPDSGVVDFLDPNAALNILKELNASA